MPVPFPGGGHTTIEHERRTPIAGGNQRKDHSPLHQDRETDRAAAPKGYEEKLHLVKKFLETKQKVEEINKLAESFRAGRKDTVIDEIERISGEILEEL